MKTNQWVIAGLSAAVAILATLLVTGRAPQVTSAAFGQDAITNGRVVALIGTEITGRYPILVVDTSEMSIMVYEYNRANFTLDLRRVRSIKYDRQLLDWTGGRGEAPSVQQVMQLLEREAVRR